MPQMGRADLAMDGLVLLDPAGGSVALDALPGVSLIVLMRHRH